MRKTAWNGMLAALLIALAGGGCSDSPPGSGADGAAPPTPDGAFTGDDAGVVVVADGGGIVITDDGGTWTCRVTTCAGRITACGDCIDNDNDGLVDSRDPECLGPCDNTEGPGLAAGIGGEGGNTCKVDCYFDFGNGPGNDQCIWDHRCDPLAPEPTICPYTPSMVGTQFCPATQPTQCANFCIPYTPNGCDCFGCCTFPELNGRGPDGGTGYVFIGALDSNNNSTCTFANISDPSKCPACTPVGNCLNECGPCEVCLGRPEPPPECFPDAGPPPDAGPEPDGGFPDAGPVDAGPTQCPDGVQPCGLPGQAECPEAFYCITGCCRPG